MLVLSNTVTAVKSSASFSFSSSALRRSFRDWIDLPSSLIVLDSGLVADSLEGLVNVFSRAITDCVRVDFQSCVFNKSVQVLVEE